jgi:hypothetical protein
MALLSPSSSASVVLATRLWIERAVIGLDLCPFARAVFDGGRIRYAVSDAEGPDTLLPDLEGEMLGLLRADPLAVATTLLIHPRALTDFLAFNEFLDAADEAVVRLGLDGVLQVASFHPAYRFSGTAPDDVTNNTNRSPHPTLHLLREDAVTEAVAAFPRPEAIYEKNIETMRLLGPSGWAALGLAPGTTREP